MILIGGRGLLEREKSLVLLVDGFRRLLERSYPYVDFLNHARMGMDDDDSFQYFFFH